MSTGEVSFTITADTKPAGKALLDLKKEIEGMPKVKSVDKGVVSQQRDFKKVLDGINKSLEQYNGSFKRYDANATRIKNLTAALSDQEKVTAGFVKEQNDLIQKQQDAAAGKAGVTFTGDDANKMSRLAATIEHQLEKENVLRAQITRLTETNAKFDEYSEQALQHILGSEKEIVADESSLLGYKIQNRQVAQDEAVAQEQITQSVNETNDSLAQTNTTARELAQTTNEVNEAASNQATGEKAEQTEQKIEELASAAERAAYNVQRIDEAMKADNASTNLAELIRRYEDLSRAKRDFEKAGLDSAWDSNYNRTIQLLETVKLQIAEYKNKLRDTISANLGLGKAGEQAGRKIKKSFSGTNSLVGSIQKGFSNLAKTTKGLKSSMDGLAHTIKNKLKHGLTVVTKYVLGFRSLFFLVRRLRKYIGEGIKNMAQFNDGNNSVNSNITKLLSSLLYLKNAWATAFSPILSFVTPMLVQLIDNVAKAGNAVSRFLGRLLGVSSVFQAVKVDAQDYASTLDNVGSSAGGAADKTKKLTDRLAAFDDLNVLGKDNDNDGTGSGGGGGDLENYVPDPNEMFKVVDLMVDLKQKLLDAWKEGDFSEFGEILAENLKNALLDLNGKWGEIQETAHKVGTSIGTFLTGFLSDPMLFEEAGRAVAEGLDTVGQAIAGFFEGYEKGSIGSAIASFFRGIFENFDWGTAGANLGELVTTLFTECSTLLKEFPTEEVTTGIEEFFKGIKWDEVVASIFSFISSAAGFVGAVSKGFASLLSGITSDDIISAFEDVDWQEVADGLGELLGGAIALTFTSIELPLTIAKAIITGLGNAWVKAMEDAEVFDEFAEGVKSGDWKKAAGALIEGLANGIGEAFVNATDWVSDHIAGPIIEGFKSCFDIHSPSGVFEDFGEFLIEGLLQGINNLIDTVMEPFTKLQGDLATKWVEIKISASQKWQEIKEKVTEKVENLRSALVQKWQDIKDNAYEKFVLLRVAIVEVFNVLKDAIKTPINGFIGVIESMVNKVIGGVNKVIEALNVLPDIKFTNPFTGAEYALGFSLPTLSTITIPRLAQGAVIPPNKEFMAVLGDQSHGTNIEAPLDTIKQAVAEVAGNEEVIQLLQQLIAVVESKNLTIGDKDIGKANARYTQQQKLIRGTSF